MVSWTEFSEAEPELAAKVRAAFDRHIHKTMATLRRDGSPRISGTEVRFDHGEMWLGSMTGAVKARDLQHDPRVALHSASAEPDEKAGTMDPDAKVSGRAVEVTDPAVFAKFADQAPPEGMHLFLVDIAEVAVTGVEGEPPELVIDYWTAAGGRNTVTRT
jgi:hypothetical protein